MTSVSTVQVTLSDRNPTRDELNELGRLVEEVSENKFTYKGYYIMEGQGKLKAAFSSDSSEKLKFKDIFPKLKEQYPTLEVVSYQSITKL